MLMVEEAYGFKYMRDMLNLIFPQNLTNDIDDLLYELLTIQKKKKKKKKNN